MFFPSCLRFLVLATITLIFVLKVCQLIFQEVPREPFLPLTQEEEAEVDRALSFTYRYGLVCKSFSLERGVDLIHM